MAEGAAVQVNGDRVIYRASALGGCIKALVAARLGYEELKGEEPTWFREGHLHEGDVLERMREEGWTVSDLQVATSLPVTDSISILGHLDAYGRPETRIVGQTRVVEVKSQSKDQWKLFETEGWKLPLWQKYEWQISAYMLAMNMPAVVVRKNRDSGKVVYEYLDEPPHDLAAIRARVLQVEALARKGSLPTECSARMWPCDYWYLHNDELEADLVTLDDPAVDKLGRQYKEAAADETAAKERKDAARKALRAGCKDNKTETKGGTKVVFYKIPAKKVEYHRKESEGMRVYLKDEEGGSGAQAPLGGGSAGQPEVTPS